MRQYFIFLAGLVVASVTGLAPALSKEQQTMTCGSQEHTYVSVEGVRLHYALIGSGDVTVVMIHGASGNLCDLKIALGDRAASSYQVLLFDRPGLGRSERPQDGFDPRVQARLMKQAANSLGIERAVVLGHSLGGFVSLSLGLNHADFAQALVLLAPVSHPWPGGVDWFHHAATAPVVGPIFRRTFVPTVGRYIGRSSTGAPFPEGYYNNAGVDLLFRAKTFKANSEDLIHTKRFAEEISPTYERLSMPVEIVSGDRDKSVSTTIHSKALVKQARNANLTVLEGVGHQIQHERPDEIFAALERAVAKSGP